MYYSLIDYIEIACISLLFYRISLWLKKDLATNLLGYFWGYITTLIVTYIFHMTILFTAALWLCPIIIMLFFLIHRDTIQKYFVVIPHLHPKTSDWHNSFIKSLLHGFSSSLSAHIILENEDSILHNLSIECPIESPISKSLLDILIHSSLRDQQKYIALSSKGTIIGCNITLFQDTSQNHKDNALLFTAHTDAIIIFADAQKRHFIRYMNARQYPACTAIELESWLKKSYPLKGINNAKLTKVSFKEHTP